MFVTSLFHLAMRSDYPFAKSKKERAAYDAQTAEESDEFDDEWSTSEDPRVSN